jgi:hypothetical protein
LHPQKARLSFHGEPHVVTVTGLRNDSLSVEVRGTQKRVPIVWVNVEAVSGRGPKENTSR